jgi:large subunit ribosomal protein L25
MPEFVVSAQGRTETGKNINRRLRAQGLIPGVVYGADKPAISVAVSPKEIGAILRSASGENTLFDLELEGSRRKVILKQFQLEPLKGQLLHADFFEVALDKRMKVKVHVELQGTPVGVKNQGGLLDFICRELECECLPTDIPERITLDVSALELGQHLRVGEIPTPDKVTILTDPEVVVAHCVVKRAEEAAAAAEAAAVETVAPGEAAAPDASAPAKGAGADDTKGKAKGKG